MSTINKIAIKNSLGEYDESKIGAQAEDVIISRDENGRIIENIETPGVAISSTEGIATTVKEIDERVATGSSIGQIQVGSGFNIDANGILTPAFGNTTGSICEGNDPRLASIGTVANDLTLSSNGDGDAAGTTFNGGAAIKISYNSIGAAPNQKATTSQWGQIKIKSNSGLGIDSTNGLSLGSHASASNIYGVGTNANYGHLKIVDATSSTSGSSYNAAAGVAASASSVADVISQISNFTNQNYKFGTSISLSPYTSSGNAFTTTSDGYVRFSNATSSDGYVDVQAIGLGALIFDYASRFGPYSTRTVFVRKGIKIFINHCSFNNSWYCVFIPILPA